jgi:hypothetical protein
MNTVECTMSNWKTTQHNSARAYEKHIYNTYSASRNRTSECNSPVPRFSGVTTVPSYRDVQPTQVRNLNSRLPIHHITSPQQMSAKGGESSVNSQVHSTALPEGQRKPLVQGKDVRIPHHKSGERDRDVVRRHKIRCEIGHTGYGC